MLRRIDRWLYMDWYCAIYLNTMHGDFGVCIRLFHRLGVTVWCVEQQRLAFVHKKIKGMAENCFCLKSPNWGIRNIIKIESNGKMIKKHLPVKSEVFEYKRISPLCISTWNLGLVRRKYSKECHKNETINQGWHDDCGQSCLVFKTSWTVWQACNNRVWVSQ